MCAVFLGARHGELCALCWHHIDWADNRVQIPKGKRDAAERAIATHERKCPAATSVRGSIPIDIQADIEET